MFNHPQFDPVMLAIGPIKLRWYGMMYLVGFASAWFLAKWRIKHYRLLWSRDELSDLIFYAALGAILGGRLGYVLFYNLSSFLAEPWSVFYFWQGGMSFHGGFLGVLLALFYFARKTQRGFWEVTDFVAPIVPIGLGAGRLGNFINGELWGRVTDVPWAIVFPHVDALPRHPSQLYELFLEGVILFSIVWIYCAKPRPTMAVSGVFSLTYGLLRFFVEFFREPDRHLGYIAFNWLSMGQLLSLPLILLGIGLLVLAYKKKEVNA